MAASEERDEEAQGLRGAELEAARVRGDESEGETPYEPSDGDEPEHAISPRSEILRERKKMAMLSERLANQRHGQVESDEEGPAGDNGECASCHTAALPRWQWQGSCEFGVLGGRNREGGLRLEPCLR